MYIKLVSLPFWLVFSVLVLAVLWLLVFEAFYSALLFTGLCVIVLPYHFSQHKHILSRLLGLFLMFTLLVFTHHYAVGEVNTRVRQLAQLTESSAPLSKLTWRDKVGLYGLNIATGLITLPFAPKIGMETLWLAIPGDESKVRVFRSDKLLDSKNIQAEITAFKRAFQQRAMTVNRTIHWSPRERLVKSEKHKAASLTSSSLTNSVLPNCHLTLTAQQSHQGWVLNISVRTKVGYREHLQTVLFSRPQVIMQERLWWLLQQDKWLYPYIADWQTQIPLTTEGKT
ncbi:MULTISPECIES: hypothetical protein [unclassified Vibrio]|uniref:DUF4131 domain-containing protein n=1 Tax=Vibrio sp. HB236076 TaxID=3232307 RepID=A0AB39HCB5_9VIBR|nr:hypothetical protein [Vibrio sp. HB161653]MDP5253441.1 hypothetical protein [Vibrio sp. HB161653]